MKASVKEPFKLSFPVIGGYTKEGYDWHEFIYYQHPTNSIVLHFVNGVADACYFGEDAENIWKKAWLQEV